MGNEQSAPRQSLGRRPANKLSKPKTNNHSSGITLIPGRSSVQGSRRNSISSTGNGNRLLTLNSESCPTNTDAGERPKGDPPKKKRMSMFRSKGHKKQDRPDAEPEVFQSFVEQGPNEQMLDRYSIQQRSRANSITTTELHYEQSVHENRERPALRERTHRWSTQQTSHPQQRNQQSSVATEHASAPTFAPEEQMISRYDSKRTSTGLRSITNSEAGDDEYIISRYDSKRTSGSGLRSRTNSETAIHVPIRRRSLQQHGVATRTGYFDGVSRQSMPTTRVPSIENLHGQPQQSPERNLHQSHPNASQNRYNDIQEYNEPSPESLHILRPTPDFLLEAPRTETPTESDYGHIGAFKLGTLRIVNGAASPAPSEREPSIDGEKDDEDVLSFKKVPSKSPKNTGNKEANGTVPPKTIASKMSWMIRSESPLHRSQEPETIALRVDTHLPLPDFSFDPFDFKLNLKNGSDLKSDFTQGGKTITSHLVEVKPQDSTQDVALSPFSFTHSPPITPQLETTSKHMAVEDSLFDAEPLTPIFPTIPRSDSKDSGYGPDVAEAERLVKGPKELLNKDRPLAKADSGYSSNISLRSFKKEKKETLTLQNQGSRKDELSRVGSGTASSFASSNSSETKKLRLQRSLPALPKQTPKVPSKESLRKVSGPPVSLRKSSGNLMGKKERKVNDDEEKISAIPKAVYESFSRETSPAISELSSTSATSTAASTAPSTTSSRWRLGGKLKRESLPLQKTKTSEPVQPFTVQAFRGVSEQLRIPKPSIEVRKNLEKREQEFPVNSFKNTLPLNYNAPPPLATQLRRTASKETLGTIFSVGSMEVREELGFARLQKSLPAVPVEQSIPEDPASSPTKEQFSRGFRKERTKPDMVQISRTVISTESKGQEKNDRSISVEQPMAVQAPVKRPPRDWGRRSLAANFREKEAPVSPPRKEVKRSLGSTSPQSPSKQVTNVDREKDLGRQTLEPVAARLLIAPESVKLEVDAQETKQDLGYNPLSLSTSEQEVLMTTLQIKNETNPVQKRQNDRQSLPSQLARSSTNLTSATNSNHLSSASENQKASSLSMKTVAEPTRIAPNIPLDQSHQTLSHRSISTKISVPALRRLYQTSDPDPAPSMPTSDLESAPLEDSTLPTRQEPQRQEWRRRSSNASRERQKTSPDSEETLFTAQTKLTNNDIIQGPTDSHLITSIASYPASDSFKALTDQSSSETLLQPLKTLQSKKSQPSLTSNSSRRSARAYPPQAHANRGPRSIFSSYQPPPAPAPGPSTHIGSQLQDQTFYAQIQRRQSQEFEPASSSPKSERSGNKPPVSMATRRSSILVKSPPPQNPGQEYFALRNEETLVANAPSAATPNVDPSWEPSQKFWSQRRRSAGNLNQNRRDNIDDGNRQQPSAGPSVPPFEQPQQTLHQRRSLNLRSDSSEPALDYPEHGIFYRGRPAKNIVEPPVPLESTMTGKPSILRHSQPSETDLRSRRSIDVRQPQPSEQELARQSRSETNKRDGSEKRSKSVGFAPQPWEPAKAAAEHDAFVKKRQSMDRMGPNGGTPQPVRKFSIDTLPSQTGQIGLSMRRASPSPVSMPLGNRRSFDTPTQHTVQGSRRSFDVSQQHQNNPQPQPQPHTLSQGSRRSFDQTQATGWTQQQKLAWSAQSHINHYSSYPPPQPQPRSQAILGTDPEFAPNFPTIPKSISTYHTPTPTPAPAYYPPSPSTHFYPNPHSRALSPRSSNPQMSPALSLTSQEEMLILDRYSGGLGYNFESGMGISGSAGTGAMAGAQGSRKSVGQREMYGVDLSDVPVMLRRVRVEN